MNIKKILAMTTCLTAAIGVFYYHRLHTYTLNVPADALIEKGSPAKTPRVLLVSMATGHGGAANSVFNYYKSLIAQGIPSILLTAPSSVLVNMAHNEKLPFATCSAFKISSKERMWQPGLQRTINKLATQFDLNIIQVNASNEIYAAHKAVAAITPHPLIVFARQIPDPLKPGAVARCAAITILSPQMVDADPRTQAQADKNNIVVKCVPPFFDENKFLQFMPSNETREQAMKRLFNINLNEALPLISKIAHFYPDPGHKNHPLLLLAIKQLMDAGTPVQAILVGEGLRKNYCMGMARELGIAHLIFFVGKTEETPTILHYADINLLASRNEGFGIVLLEGGLMKKPSIVATDTGAANTLIENGQTGLLFENNNATDLARAIKQLLDDPQTAQKLGEALHDKIIREFSNAVSTNKMVGLYQQLLG